MDTTSLVAYIPVSNVNLYIDTPSEEYVDDTLDELCSLSDRLEFPLMNDEGAYRPTIEVVDVETACKQCPELRDYIAGEEAHTQARSTEVIRISAELEISDTPIESQTGGGETEIHTGEQASQILGLGLPRLHGQFAFKPQHLLPV